MSDVPRQVPESVTTLITGAVIVTMDAEHRILSDGALAVRGDRIVGIGPSREMDGRFEAEELIDGRRFLITPGFVDSHVHITGDPLTRGYVPDDIEATPEERFEKWVMPRFLAHTADDEHVSAQLAALQMLRSGTTCFLEAGTVLHLDAVVDGLRQTGIRARVGAWVEGRVRDEAEDQTRSTDAAIAVLEEEVTRFPADQGARIAAWPILVGHATNTDEVWKAAKRLADRKGLGISAHMSPLKADPDWYLENVGRRPLEHLADIGVLGDRLSLTHLVHLSAHEVELLAESGTNAIHCPLAALRGAFGIAAAGRFPEMHAAGVNIGLGSDGDVPDLMHKMSLASAIFKDARQQAWIFPADETLAMAITGGARLMQLQDDIGSLAIGRKADFVLHDTDRPEWKPWVNALHQLVWSGDGRGVHSVWVDGVRVVNNYRATLIDEQVLYRKAQLASERVLKRSGLPARCAWPVM